LYLRLGSPGLRIAIGPSDEAVAAARLSSAAPARTGTTGGAAKPFYAIIDLAGRGGDRHTEGVTTRHGPVDNEPQAAPV